MKLRLHTSEDPNIDLTSLIDVVFLLLIFFMVSTTFEHPTRLKVDLPEASTAQHNANAPEILELVIDSDGRMFLNDRQLVDSREQTLIAAFNDAVGQDRSQPLVLRADRLTAHHFVVTAMDVAAQLGFTNLSIAAEQADGPAQ